MLEILSPFKSKTVQFIVLVAVVSAIPITVMLSQEQQNLRQQAAEKETIFITPTPTPAY